MSYGSITGPSMKQNSYLGNVSAGLAVLFWSIVAYLFCFLKALPPFQLLSLMQISGGLVGLLFERKMLTVRTVSQRVVYGWPILLFLFLTPATYMTSIRMAPIVQVDLIFYSWPILLVLLGSQWLNKPLYLPHYIGMVIGLFGLVVLVWADLSLEGVQWEFLFGYLIALLSGLSWVFYSFLNQDPDKKKRKYSSHGEDLLLIGGLSLIVSYATEEWAAMEWSETGIVLLSGALIYGVSYPLWGVGIKHSRFTVIGAMANAIPILSIAWLIVGGFAEFSLTVCLATLLVTIGGVLLSRNAPSSQKVI